MHTGSSAEDSTSITSTDSTIEDIHSTTSPHHYDSDNDSISSTSSMILENDIGDDIYHKASTTVRIVLSNIRGILIANYMDKNNSIRSAINESKGDIICMPEFNHLPPKLQVEDRWQNRTKSWWEHSHHSIAYNQHELHGHHTRLHGGNLITTLNPTSHRVHKSIRDKTGLGRWTCTTYRGKNNILTTVICAYRPIKHHRPQEFSAYCQHERWLTRSNDLRDPVDAFYDDLSALIQEFQQNHHQIILAMDANEDVTSASFKSKLDKWELVEAVGNHINHPTTIPTRTPGSKQIDGIFVSPSLNIARAGFLHFGFFPSDHRALWIDIHENNMFGFNMSEIPRPHARRLKNSDPRVVKKFNSMFKAQLAHAKIVPTLYNIQSNMVTPLQQEFHHPYEKIYTLVDEALCTAEQHCRKLHMGVHEWSAEYAEVDACTTMWKGVVDRRKGLKFSRMKIRRLAKTANIQHPLQATLEEAEKNLIEARQRKKEIVKSSKQLRDTFRETLAQAKEDAGEGDKAKHIRQMGIHEGQRTSARIIKYTLDRLQDSGGVSRVEIKEGNTIIELTNKDDIEQACIAENTDKFLQTSDTPCMQDPLYTLLGDGNTPFCADLLEGKAILPPNTNQYVREYFDELKQVAPSEFNQGIPTALFQEYWKKKGEFISSGSQVHNGMMKAIAKDSQLSNIMAALFHIPYVTGYAPQTWRNVIDCMLKKKGGSSLVNKLRTITLNHPGFQFNNAILSHRTFSKGEENKLLANEQYGSRKNKRAVHHAVNKALTFDLSRQTRRPMALCICDAKSCYDRVVHSIGTLAFRRLGIPFEPAKCMFTTIGNMKHRCRTKFMDSVYYASADGQLRKFQGVLQGNTASPCVWVIVSTPLLNMLRTHRHGVHLLGAISQNPSHFVAYAFVDDTDLPTLDLITPNITAADVMKEMQATIDRWEGGLKATGGALVADKTGVWAIDYEFAPDGSMQYKPLRDIPEAKFHAKDHQETPHNLDCYEYHEAKETLGVFLAPDGNTKTAVEELRKKALKWKHYVLAGHMDSKHVWQALHTVVMKQIQYPAVALYLSEQDCRSIMAPLLTACLTKTRHNRNFPRAAVYGPRDTVGMDVPNLYWYQGAEKIDYLHNFYLASTIEGELLRASMDWTLTEIGIGHRQLFQIPYKRFGCLASKSFLQQIWEFADKYNITIESESFPKLTTLRQNDLYLMEMFDSLNLSTKTLQRLNHCRKYLQVVTLADIVEGDGLTINVNAWKGIKLSDRVSPYKWPYQARPDDKYWNIWRTTLRKLFNIRRLRQTDHPLGMYNYTDNWIWYHATNRHTMYSKHLGIIKVYLPVRQGSSVFKLHGNALHMPLNVHLATVIQFGDDRLLLTGSAPMLPKTGEIPATFTAGDVQYLTPTNIQALLHGLQSPLGILIGSDGSYDPEAKIGTASSIIAPLHHLGNVIAVSGVTPGPTSSQCAYRSELHGILLSIMYINYFCKIHHISDGKATLNCDGLGAVNMTSWMPRVVSSNCDHFDLLHAINYHLTQSPLQWSIHHIDGHADKHTRYSDLSLPQKINVIADDHAKTYRRAMQGLAPELQQQQIHPHGIAIYMHNTLLTHKLSKSIQYNISRPQLRSYWTGKFKWDQSTALLCDWDSLGTAVVSSRYKTWLTKWISGWCGTGSALTRWQYQQHDNCPRCNEPNETTQHVILCQAVNAELLWEARMGKFRELLSDLNTEPSLINYWISSLHSWRNELPMPISVPHQDALDLHQAYTHQTRLGWWAFMCGFWPKEWSTFQLQHLISNQVRHPHTKVRRWSNKVRRFLWETCRLMWAQRNEVNRPGKNAATSQEIEIIDAAITIEFYNPPPNLLPHQLYLFNTTLRSLLDSQYSVKFQWLLSIWSIWDLGLDTLDIKSNLHNHNPHLHKLYLQWRNS